MTLARMAAATMSSLVTVAKRYALDSSTTDPKWSESEYLLAMNYAAIEMQMRTRGRSGHGLVGAADLTYTGDAEAEQLPADVGYQSIYKVQDVTDTNAPSDITWGPVNELHSSREVVAKGVQASRRRWTLIVGAGDSLRPKIAIWPKPRENLSLRIWYFAPGIVGEGDDDFFLAVEWQELVAMGAARRLRALHNEEWGRQAEMIYQELLQLYEEMPTVKGQKPRPRRRQW